MMSQTKLNSKIIFYLFFIFCFHLTSEQVLFIVGNIKPNNPPNPKPINKPKNIIKDRLQVKSLEHTKLQSSLKNDSPIDKTHHSKISSSIKNHSNGSSKNRQNILIDKKISQSKQEIASVDNSSSINLSSETSLSSSPNLSKHPSKNHSNNPSKVSSNNQFNKQSNDSSNKRSSNHPSANSSNNPLNNPSNNPSNNQINNKSSNLLYNQLNNPSSKSSYKSIDQMNNEQNDQTNDKSDNLSERQINNQKNSKNNQQSDLSNNQSIKLSNDKINRKDDSSSNSSKDSSSDSSSNQQNNQSNTSNNSNDDQTTSSSEDEPQRSAGPVFRFACPIYKQGKDRKKEIIDFMRYSYDSAVDLCNTSSRVGCHNSNFLREISTCINRKYFDTIDVIEELKDQKHKHDLPRNNSDQPVLGYVSFKIMNIDAVSVKHMDFMMDFYMEVEWQVRGESFRKYMTRICVSKKLDMSKKKKIVLYQDDLRLFWLPDLYFPNSKSHSESDKHQLERPTSRNYLEIHLANDENNIPYLHFTFITSGHSTLLCPMSFDQYPADIQKCVVKIRSFFYYKSELELVWKELTLNDLQLLEYSIKVKQGIDTEEDHFVVLAGDLDKNFTRLLINFNFTRLAPSKLTGVYLPSMMLITFNYFTYFFGVNSYSSRSSIGIMVLLTLTIMFSKVRAELPGSTNVSLMEEWLIVCFICDIIQLIEASIVEKIYGDHCIEYHLKKQEKRKLETEYLGYSYSMLFDDDTSEDDSHFEDDHLDDSNIDSNCLCKSIVYLEDLIIHLILPSFSRKKPEYWCVFLDKLFRLIVPILFLFFCINHWNEFINSFD